MRDHDLSDTRHHQTGIETSILTPTIRPRHSPVRDRIAQTTSRTLSFRPTSNIRRLAAEDHCDPRQIRPGPVSPADEGDQLPRQDREAPGRASHHALLEHNRKSRENSESRSLRKPGAQEIERIDKLPRQTYFLLRGLTARSFAPDVLDTDRLARRFRTRRLRSLGDRLT